MKTHRQLTQFAFDRVETTIELAARCDDCRPAFAEPDCDHGRIPTCGHTAEWILEEPVPTVAWTAQAIAYDLAGNEGASETGLVIGAGA